MKSLLSLGVCLGLCLPISAEELTKKEKEEQILAMVKRYVEQKANSSEFIISTDKTNASKNLLAKLENPMTIEWDSKSLKEVCDDIRTFLDINVIIHKEVSKDAIVDMRVKGMKGINVLKWILRSQELRGSLVDGVFFITPIDKTPVTNTILVTYDINDLTNTIKDFPASEMGSGIGTPLNK